MKPIFTVVLLFFSSDLFSQWKQIQQLPSANIFTLTHSGDTIYAAGRNIVYKSKNQGQSWDSTLAIPGLSSASSVISNIILYKHELYLATNSSGVVKSADEGISWVAINQGLPSNGSVTGFCVFNGVLYASTEGNFGASIYNLSDVKWLPFSKGLSALSSNLTSIISTSNTILAGANINGLYDYLASNSLVWEERFLTNPPITAEGVADIISAHDTLFLAGKTGFFYFSIDEGLTWNFFGNRLVTGATFLVNAKQALISSRYVFNGSNNTLFYYIKKDALQGAPVNFSTVANHFTWKLDIVGDKLWDASDHGLFFMSLSDLPGITAADDSSTQVVLAVPLKALHVQCAPGANVVHWQASSKADSMLYTVERSIDETSWVPIGIESNIHNDSHDLQYSFTDLQPFSNASYRIAQHYLNGTVAYSSVVHSSCFFPDALQVFPNPVHNNLVIKLTASKASKGEMQIFTASGALIKKQKINITTGSNQLNVDMKPFKKGAYYLRLQYNQNLLHKTVQLLKQ